MNNLRRGSFKLETARRACNLYSYCRVVINNNNVENIGGETINLAVDAINAAGLADVKEADCTPNTVFADVASQDITLRPTVSPAATLVVVAKN